MSCCSSESKSCCCGVAWNILVALAALLIVAVLVWAMRHYTLPEDLTAQRAAERAKNLADVQAEVALAADSYAWINPANGVVQLPVDRAVELAVAAWAEPAAARADLLKRTEKAFYVPPPEPEAPGEFE